jgi:hypothetical protein
VHTRGIVCSGEVWNQFIDFATPETVGEWMSQLNPELQGYFQRLAERADFAGCRAEQERAALRLLIDWYESPRT